MLRLGRRLAPASSHSLFAPRGCPTPRASCDKNWVTLIVASCESERNNATQGNNKAAQSRLFSGTSKSINLPGFCNFLRFLYAEEARSVGEDGILVRETFA